MARRQVPPAQGIEVLLAGRIYPAAASPRSVQYRGARYVLAEDALEATEKSLRQMTKGVRDHAKKLLDKAVIQVKGKPEIASSGEGDQKDGFELKYDLAQGNFSGLKAELYVDYLVKGKNALGEPAGWWDSAVSLFSKKETVQEIGGTYNLHQMVFRFCKGNHASLPDRSPKIGQMLETIAFLQGAGDQTTVKASREEGKELPEGGAEANTMITKAMNALYENFKGRTFEGYHADKPYPSTPDKWDAALWHELTDTLLRVGTPGLSQGLVKGILDFVDLHHKEGDLTEIMKRLKTEANKPKTPTSLEGAGGVREVMKTKLATIINQGPYRINYTAWDRMAISGDAKGNVILKIAAPMKPYFTFEKSAGGPPVLVEASCWLCGRIFASKQGDEAAAAKLAWTGVVLGRGAALGVNPVETEHLQEESWLAELRMQLPEAVKVKGTETETKTTETGTGEAGSETTPKPATEAPKEPLTEKA
jgi:hypothetical protein